MPAAPNKSNPKCWQQSYRRTHGQSVCTQEQTHNNKTGFMHNKMRTSFRTPQLGHRPLAVVLRWNNPASYRGHVLSASCGARKRRIGRLQKRVSLSNMHGETANVALSVGHATPSVRCLCTSLSPKRPSRPCRAVLLQTWGSGLHPRLSPACNCDSHAGGHMVREKPMPEQWTKC